MFFMLYHLFFVPIFFHLTGFVCSCDGTGCGAVVQGCRKHNGVAPSSPEESSAAENCRIGPIPAVPLVVVVVAVAMVAVVVVAAMMVVEVAGGILFLFPPADG